MKMIRPNPDMLMFGGIVMHDMLVAHSLFVMTQNVVA